MQLLQGVSDVVDALPLTSQQVRPETRVRLLVLQGRDDEALLKLREVADANWRGAWWYFFDHDPVLEPLRKVPQFQAIRAEIAADMAKQLAHVREMEASGEIEVPGDSNGAGESDKPETGDESNS